jgi:3-oxoacyl-[acyl-carrier protein] reductase
MTDPFFAGRVAVVTGAGRGMGASHCQAFARAGAHVVAADLHGDAAGRVADDVGRQFGARAIGVATDVASETSVAALFDRVGKEFGRVDFLVNNAAIMLDLPVPFKPFWEMEYAEWNRVMAVNAGGVFLCCRAAFPFMSAAQFGRIVNVSSDAIYKGYESQLHYFASKGAVAIMTRNLAREFGPFKVTVNALAPGYTKSEAVAQSVDMQRVEPLILKSQCLPLVQTPEDVSGSVMFLCGPAATCITGQSLVVNCGAIMP